MVMLNIHRHKAATIGHIVPYAPRTAAGASNFIEATFHTRCEINEEIARTPHA